MSPQLPFLFPLLFPKQIWEIPNSDKKVFLTFDDGPIPEITEWVLDLLQYYQIKATFFCIGDNIQKHPDIFKRIIHEGHQIGNHTYHHVNGWKTETKNYIEEVVHCTEQIEKNSLITTRLIRPPYGKIKRSQVRELLKRDYKIIMWSVLSKDFDYTTTPEKCLQNVINHSKSGSIILFHDSIKASGNLKFALPRAIDYLLAKGYRFDVL